MPSFLDSVHSRIIDSRHPSFLSSMTDWDKWRVTYRGGEEFRNRYLEQFTSREERPDFESRKAMTPIPAFAKSAINEIRNSIFQRMRDIVRIGGSQSYMQAVNGLNLGVDRRGSTMNAFLGMKCLTELLVMGRVGVFVDNSIIEGETLLDAVGAQPYLYPYQAEDILSWTCTSPDQPSQFQAVLLRDTCMNYDRHTMLPMETFQRFRMLWIDENSGMVNLQFHDLKGNKVDRDGNPSEAPTVLELDRIPFVLMDVGDSLIRDVCQHQIALLNLCSSDVNYALKANFPFYIEQKDFRAGGSHLKQAANPDGTATSGGQTAHDSEMKVGVTQGRYYDIKANAPAFINPSSEPLKASLELQGKLENDIRKLVNLAVQNLASRASAESKSMDNQGLEAGLSFIGLVLENAERQIAEFWAAYEERRPTQRNVAIVKYPDRYSLKNDDDRIKEATELTKLMFSLPGRTVKKEIAKSSVYSLLGGRVGPDVIEKINKEIDSSDYLTSDPNTIIQASEAGLVGEQLASMALGFPETEFLQAREDHALRVARIAEAQAAQNPGPVRIQGSRAASASIAPPKPALSDPGARGVADLSANQSAGKQEKANQRDTTLNSSKKSPVRGNSRDSRVTGKKE